MSLTLAASIFLARARRRRKKGESYFSFWLRDLQSDTRKIKSRRRRISSDPELEEDILGEQNKRSRRRSRGRSRRSRSRNPTAHNDEKYVSLSDHEMSNHKETTRQIV